jgi:hypothetical protein
LIEYAQIDAFCRGSIREAKRWMVLHRPSEPAGLPGLENLLCRRGRANFLEVELNAGLEAEVALAAIAASEIVAKSG